MKSSMPSTSPRYFALIPAAGVGARMAAGGPKQYLTIGGRPMLAHTIAAFLASDSISHTYVVVSADDGLIDGVMATLTGTRDTFAKPGSAARVSVLRCGGATRMDSILNGLQAIEGQVGAGDWVLVHDAARPGLNAALIASLVDTVGSHPVGGLLALPVVDTVKQVGEATLATLPRAGLWLAQTPQMFRFALLRDALSAAREGGAAAAITDDASAVEALGLTPLLVEGHPRNLKVTLPRDLEIAALYLNAPAGAAANAAPTSIHPHPT